MCVCVLASVPIATDLCALATVLCDVVVSDSNCEIVTPSRTLNT